MHHSTSLFDNDGRPSPALIELLKLFDLAHDGTVTGIRDATQEAWYQAGKLRAEIAEKHGDKRETALPLFRQLGLVDEVRCRQMQYSDCVLFGATVVAVRKRLAFLLSEWKRGVRFAGLVCLGSNRPLLADKESPAVLLQANNPDLPIRDEWSPEDGDLPTTEIEMMRMVYSQAQFPGVGLTRDQVTFLAPDVMDRNANTRDTLQQWGVNVARSVLLVSSQPFITFQRVVAEKVLPAGAQIDCIGYAAPNLPVTTFLDSIAKLIFELAT